MRQREEQRHDAPVLCRLYQDEDGQRLQFYGTANQVRTLTLHANLHLTDKLSLCRSCLAHVINLATQALIASYSKSKYFDPANPEDHIPDLEASVERDEVGLVRTITVKVSGTSV